jgi:hypothetical protein
MDSICADAVTIHKLLGESENEDYHKSDADIHMLLATLSLTWRFGSMYKKL